MIFIVDDKLKIKLKIFLQDSADVLKNISTGNEKPSTTIVASKGLIESKKRSFQRSNIIKKNNKENEIIKFEQLNIDLKISQAM